MGVHAIYRNRLYRVLDAPGDECHLADGPIVDFADVIVDPTDVEVAKTENLGEWFNLQGEELDRYRTFLLGNHDEPYWPR